jgi:hypothetical protein
VVVVVVAERGASDDRGDDDVNFSHKEPFSKKKLSSI